jgi:hypothetical protein
VLDIDLKGLLAISSKGKKREFVEFCQQPQIVTSKRVKKVNELWKGKPRGFLQILWECGLSDGANLSN